MGSGLYSVRLYDVKKTGLYGVKYYFPISDQNRSNLIFN